MAELTEFGDEELGRIFSYLDGLRESDKTNMYGATPYLEEVFALTDDEAGTVLLAWMRSYSSDQIDERIAEARNTA